MLKYKSDFIDLMTEAGVLQFGDFVTKSGRKSPYFINTGLYRSGSQIKRLGEFYADAILENLGTDFNVLFGPAYKAIPLVVTTAAALADRGHDVGFCFNRKEAKDHGERGILVGHQLADSDRVLIVEDITTAGTSIRETVPILTAAAQIVLAGLIVSVDRGERGTGDVAALQQTGEDFDMPTFAIVTVQEIIEHCDIDANRLAAMQSYLAQYGPR